MMTRVLGRRAALSLIELLVVTAIIGILVAMIIPAIAKVRAMARRAANQNNIRQIMLAVNNYAASHDGSFSESSAGLRFPGLGVGNCAETKWNSDKTIRTQTGCDGTIASQVLGMQYPWKIYSREENPKVSRTDWVDGGMFFYLTPYLGHDEIWAKSYGPMGSYRVDKSWDDGWRADCPCTKTQECPLGEGSCDTCLERPACNPSGWKITTSSPDEMSKINFGYMAGRAASRIPVYLGQGDPAAANLSYLAPLSFPRVRTPLPENIEAVNVSYTPYIAECYSLCRDSQSWGVYNSWLGKTNYNDYDKDPVPASHDAWPVEPGIAQPRNYLHRIWTGLTGDGTPGSMEDIAQRNFSPYQEQWYWINDNIVAKLPDTKTRTQYNRTWYTLSPVGQSDLQRQIIDAKIFRQISPTLITPEQQALVNCQVNTNAAECHLGEWYYDIRFTAARSTSQFFQDEATQCSGGIGASYNSAGEILQWERPGVMHSLVPGIINVGMLDGSVKTFTPDTSTNVVIALMNGTPPNRDW